MTMKKPSMLLKSALSGLPIFIALLSIVILLVCSSDETSFAHPGVWFVIFMCAAFSLILGNADADPGDCAGF